MTAGIEGVSHISQRRTALLGRCWRPGHTMGISGEYPMVCPPAKGSPKFWNAPGIEANTLCTALSAHNKFTYADIVRRVCPII
jgi:hypothetical protein